MRNLDPIIYPTSQRKSRGLSKALSIVVLLILCACSNARPELKVLTAPVDLKKPDKIAVVPNPLPIKTLPIKWQVITPERLPPGNDWVLYAITPKDYENLAKTQADTVRWIDEAAWRLDYYRGEE